MDKIAFSYMHGAELALALYLDSEVEGLSKEASLESADEGFEGLLEEAAYRQQQQEIAHNNGAYGVLAKVAEAFESDDFDAEAFLGEVKTAMVAIEEAALVPETEEEDAQMFEALVKGASAQLQSLYGDLDEEQSLQIAQGLIANQLSQEG